MTVYIITKRRCPIEIEGASPEEREWLYAIKAEIIIILRLLGNKDTVNTNIVMNNKFHISIPFLLPPSTLQPLTPATPQPTQKL